MFRAFLKFVELRGLQASGKTTLAKTWQEKSPGIVRVNRDDLRSMLRGNGYRPSNEPMIIACEKAVATAAVREGYNVVIDDTNVFGSTQWKELADQLGVKHTVVDLDISIEEAISRDAGRENPVGAKVIRATAKRAGKT